MAAALAACSAAPSAVPTIIPMTATPSVVPTRTTPPDAAMPTSVIVMVGDGMGFAQQDLATLWRDGTSAGEVTIGADGKPTVVPRGPGTLAMQQLDVQVAMSTYPVRDGIEPDGYDPELAWSDPDWVAAGASDSAAAATALATGVKTADGMVGVDSDGEAQETLAERAISLGRSAGLVTSVPFSDAASAAFATHEVAGTNSTGIAHQLLSSKLSVVIGAGHPWYDDNHLPLAQPAYTWISAEDWAALTSGSTGFTFVDASATFNALASGATPPTRLFGVPKVGSTLQERRAGASVEPGDVARNAVPDLATLSLAALDVLGRNPQGYVLEVDGGAIAWASRDHDTARTIEEVESFDAAVAAVENWITARDAWSSTLLVVAGSVEAGRAAGPAGPWSPITGSAGTLPDATWYSNGDTNALVPFAAQGAGAMAIGALAHHTDPVRGPYLDNTDLARILLHRLWAPAGSG
jgi:alkaline phosphatase